MSRDRQISNILAPVYDNLEDKYEGTLEAKAPSL
jgi:hypothetical protein